MIFNGNDKCRSLLKENSVNEAIGNKLSFLFWKDSYEAYFITNGWYDVSLQERCNQEHKIFNEIKACGEKSVFISIYTDAYHVKDKAKRGLFFYNSPSGEKIAHSLTNFLRNNGYGLELREPMKANFKVLRST